MSERKEKRMTARQRKQAHLRAFWQSRVREGGVQKLETGISGFDELLEGGLPEGRVTLVSAGPGCGKTMLLSEFIYRGAKEFDQGGVFVTFEERPEDILRNLRSFAWELDPLIEAQKLVFLDAASYQEGEVAIGEAEWLEPMLARIEYTAHKIGATRLALDNLGSVFLRYSRREKDAQDVRERLFTCFDRIKRLGLTALVSTENLKHRSSLSHYDVDEFVSDGLIELSSHSGQGVEVRDMLVRKLRGCSYRGGKVQFEINSDGLEVFPRIPLDTSVGDTEFEARKQFGIPKLDQALCGGIPQGHILLIAGNTGTGKTTLALHFLHEGLSRGESVVWVALEEPVKVVLKKARAHGWDLQDDWDSGSLQFVTSPLIDVVPDKLLYQIIDAVKSSDVRRVIVDSISSLESSSMQRDAVRDFMLQLTGFAKIQGVTMVLNYLSDEAFGAEKGQLLGSLLSNPMRLSSIVDGILLLRYVERDYSVRKLLNILKLRGSGHDKGLFRYDIDQSGFVFGEQFGTDT